ncbi:hypothetical protein [Glaciimonas immobilis]|uniref:Uncharacterized protein n=1 Tax=Glaciimonas immobilis TaxID=728004 RepID=A0A840RWC0_9BURK|nr:hypothetical protein [Glaciimonas immobilis]KAF3997554.1 hypothetical protein HAV38_12815 [Glaciimonas immobilis]MBB5200760.1 hypothetical protein [Glaciimonas immobilis]
MARSSAEKSGASKDVQNLAEMGGGMAPGAIGLGARELVRGGKNAMANSMKSIFDRPFAREGAELSKSTGIRLTPGQESGHQGISLGENSARQSFVTSDKVLKADQEQAQQAIAAVKKIADGISAQDLSKAGIGERLQTAMNNAVENIAKVRKSTGDKDYAEVRALANGKPVIPYNNVTKELQAIIEENTGVVSADARKIVSQAKSQLAEMMETQEPSKILNANGKIPPPPKPLPKVDDVETARRNRSSWSKAARGQGDIFTDVSPDANRVVASRLARAIGKDFEEASSAKTPFADALKKANKNYADYSDSITYVNNSSLGKLLGIETTDAGVTGAISNTISGEKVAQRFLAMQPSEAKTVANILKQHAPDVLQESKSYIVRDALKKGLDVPISKGANAIPLSYNKVIKGLPDNEYLEAVGFTHKEVLEINNVSKAMQRSGDRSGMNFSGTAPMNHFIEMLGTLTGGTKKILSTAAQVTVLNKIASAMTKKEGREALMTIAKFDPRKQASREITKAVTIINAENTDNK